MDTKAAAGCFVTVWDFLIVRPLWLVLVFGILSRLDAPTWLWACYWVYVPSIVVGAILGGVWRMVASDE